MTVKERLKIFIKSKGISDSAFCKAIGVSTSYISAMRQSIPPAKLHSVASAFPDLNIEWLLTGTGEMLNSGPRQVRFIHNLTDPEPPDSVCPDCLKKEGKIEALEETIKRLEARLEALLSRVSDQIKEGPVVRSGPRAVEQIGKRRHSG